MPYKSTLTPPFDLNDATQMINLRIDSDISRIAFATNGMIFVGDLIEQSLAKRQESCVPRLDDVYEKVSGDLSLEPMDCLLTIYDVTIHSAAEPRKRTTVDQAILNLNQIAGIFLVNRASYPRVSDDPL